MGLCSKCFKHYQERMGAGADASSAPIAPAGEGASPAPATAAPAAPDAAPAAPPVAVPAAAPAAAAAAAPASASPSPAAVDPGPAPAGGGGGRPATPAPPAAPAAGVGGGEEEDGPPERPVQKNPGRCWKCNKKVGLTGFKCKCGYVFCGAHRYAGEHECDFDYKTTGREAIAKANPVVVAPKLERF